MNSHQQADLIPWEDYCWISLNAYPMPIHFEFEQDKAAIIANQWIRNLVSGN